MKIAFLDHPVLFFHPLRRPPARSLEELTRLLNATLVLHIDELKTSIDFKISIRPRWRRFGAPKYEVEKGSLGDANVLLQAMFLAFVEFEGEVTDVPVLRRLALIAAMAEASGIDTISIHLDGETTSGHELIAAETMLTQLDKIK